MTKTHWKYELLFLPDHLHHNTKFSITRRKQSIHDNQSRQIRFLHIRMSTRHHFVIRIKI